jgi:hypothetical protein
MRESHIEKHYCQQVKALGGMAIKLTSMIGLPDRLIILKDEIFFVEFKAPGKTPRKIQQYVITKLRNLGATVHVIDSITTIPTKSS